jgi:hypothetical protein
MYTSVALTIFLLLLPARFCKEAAVTDGHIYAVCNAVFVPLEKHTNHSTPYKLLHTSLACKWQWMGQFGVVVCSRQQEKVYLHFPNTYTMLSCACSCKCNFWRWISHYHTKYNNTLYNASALNKDVQFLVLFFLSGLGCSLQHNPWLNKGNSWRALWGEH